MRNLIGVHAAHMLQRRAGVVDLVKIAGVEKARLRGGKRLLVGQLAHRAPRKRRAVGAEKRQLAQFRIAPGGKPDEARAALERKLVPFQQRHVILIKLARVEKALAVVRQGKRIAARADHAVGHRAGDLIFAAKLQRKAFALAQRDGGLRRFHAAEMGKGGDRVKQRDKRDGDPLKAALPLSAI